MKKSEMALQGSAVSGPSLWSSPSFPLMLPSPAGTHGESRRNQHVQPRPALPLLYPAWPPQPPHTAPGQVPPSSRPLRSGSAASKGDAKASGPAPSSLALCHPPARRPRHLRPTRAPGRGRTPRPPRPPVTARSPPEGAGLGRDTGGRGAGPGEGATGSGEEAGRAGGQTGRQRRSPAAAPCLPSEPLRPPRKPTPAPRRDPAAQSSVPHEHPPRVGDLRCPPHLCPAARPRPGRGGGGARRSSRPRGGEVPRRGACPPPCPPRRHFLRLPAGGWPASTAVTLPAPAGPALRTSPRRHRPEVLPWPGAGLQEGPAGEARPGGGAGLGPRWSISPPAASTAAVPEASRTSQPLPLPQGGRRPLPAARLCLSPGHGPRPVAWPH